VEFAPIPRFAPEHFATLRAKQVTRQKQFQKGLAQLEEEGVMQVLSPYEGLRSEPILAVVGELQFDVMQSRLESEYNVETTVAALPYKLARWIDRDVHEVVSVGCLKAFHHKDTKITEEALFVSFVPLW